ncbi:zf-UBP-domain-containing protein [Backusella circina FSU 941]|nr:zf-UBP-domain-containing protein [Backusella circina FSU 941]
MTKGPPIASIIPVNSNTHENYGILSFQNDIVDTKSAPVEQTSIIICTAGIPFDMSIPEFLDFVAPVDSSVSHYKIICDVEPQMYMVLMKFRDRHAAKEYYQQYNNRPFSSMEPEVCKVVFIQSIEISSVVIPPYTFPFLNHVDDDTDDSLCPVCLEKMDEGYTALLTILCQHTFHSHCLSKWGDGSCPICRYSQKQQQSTIESSISPFSNTREGSSNPLDEKSMMVILERSIGDHDDENECYVCKTREKLWVCLICGYVGCGRYEGAHAYDHYKETSHLYALESETQRVWDYANDGYVHRLIQNVVDGKLVELPNTEQIGNRHDHHEKEEAISLEYNYLLSSQLDSQRIYYEDQLRSIESKFTKINRQIKASTEELVQIREENKRLSLENKVKLDESSQLEIQKQANMKQLDEWKKNCEETKNVLLQEKKTTNLLLGNNDNLIRCIEERKQGIQELSDQVRDLKFFLEARETVQGNPELEGGSVETHTRTRNTKKRGKR